MHKLLPGLLVFSILFAACSTNNVTEDDSFKSYFDSAGVKGCFALFDNGQGHFTVYNLPRYRDSAYAPGATFDIVQSLIAFQTGIAKDDKTVMPGDSVTLAQAFRVTGAINDTVFRQLTDRIGKDTSRKWADTLRYGKKITADEQLGLIKKLYFGQLPFFRRPQELVREMMIAESNSNYKLVYKKAFIQYDNHVFGWLLGWVEENKHPYFFVLNIESPDTKADISDIGLQLVKQILPSMGFFQGKK